MDYIPIENCLNKSQGSVYKLTAMVAKRAQEIAEGSKPYVESIGEVKPVRLALREIQEGYLTIEPNNNSKKQK